MNLLASALMVVVAGYSAYGVLKDPKILNSISVPIWLWWAYGRARDALRNQIVMSPAGISVTHGRSASTPWSNVERIQVLTAGSGIKVGAVPCLVLREPAEGTMKPIVHGVPDALKGRVIPLFPFQWARIAELEQELYGYLPVSPDGGQLAVPPSLSAISQRHERTSQRILGALVVILGLGVFWLLRGIIW